MFSPENYKWNILYFTSIFTILLLVLIYIYIESGPSQLTSILYILPFMGLIEIYIYKLINSKYIFLSANELALESLKTNVSDLPDPDFGINNYQKNFIWFIVLSFIIFIILLFNQKDVIKPLLKNNKENIIYSIVILIIISVIYISIFHMITNNYEAINTNTQELNNNLFKEIADNQNVINCMLPINFNAQVPSTTPTWDNFKLAIKEYIIRLGS